MELSHVLCSSKMSKSKELPGIIEVMTYLDNSVSRLPKCS